MATPCLDCDLALKSCGDNGLAWCIFDWIHNLTIRNASVINKTQFLLLLVSVVFVGPVLAEPVDFQTLLDEIVDRDELPKLPVNDYKLGQTSSYDRRSKSPSQGWYANGDGSGFVRVETNQGRTERVLMDEQGPGAIVRFWSTYLTWEFGDGILRFYFDGATTPSIEGRLTDIIHGTHLVDGVLAQSTGGFLENEHILAGRNLYLPLPYESGCKVTYEGNDNPFYYAINFRKYVDGTEVRTFSMDDLRRHKATLASVQNSLKDNPTVTSGAELSSVGDVVLAAGSSHMLSVRGGNAIRQVLLELDAEDYRQALRSTVLGIEFDGKQTVWVPVGDFFGTGYELSPYESRYHKVTSDGRLLCRWVMPFQSKAQVTIYNLGKQTVHIKNLSVHHAPWNWDERSLYFHAGWRLYSEAPSAKGRDTNYQILHGRGKYVGDSLAVFNAVSGNEGQPWWGEGDEKIYVDGETFPSNFGTGTEDYYGYAWVGCTPFSHPFLAQPRAQGNRGPGLTVNNRWRLLDAIPFHSSFRIDMEIWHWANDVTVDYAPTTFWYATESCKSVVDLDAGTTTVRPPDVEGAKLRVRFVDRIEAEAMVRREGSEATTLVHTMPHSHDLSNRSYLLIQNLEAGEELKMTFHANRESNGTLELACVGGHDSMIIDLLLNDELLLEDIDLHCNKPTSTRYDVPNTKFRKGVNSLVVRAKGANSKVPDANEIGIDYLQVSE